MDEYELSGAEIVRGRGSRPEDRLQIADIKSWQIHPEMVFDIVQITLTDGLEFVWLDRHNDLIAALRRVAPKAELNAI